MGSRDGVVEIDFLERSLLPDSVSHEDCEVGEDGEVLYRASFKEMEENYLKYQTAQWVLYSLLLILAWGIGLLMLLYLPIRRYILRKDFRSRMLYMTSDAIVYKVTRPVPFPCCGVLNKEKHILLPSVADVVVEQGYLQSLFGICSIRIENAGVRRPASDDVQIQGIANPRAFRKAVLTRLSNLGSDGFSRQVSTNEDLPAYGLGYSPATWARQNIGAGLTPQPMVHEGYQEHDDQILPRPTSTGLSTAPSMSDSMVTEMQFPEAVGGQPVAAQPSGVVTTANCSNPSMNPSQNLLAGTRMLPPGNTQALQMSQGYLPGIGMPTRPQLDQASLQQQHNQPTQIQQQQQQQQQQQHQQPQMQRSSSLFHPSNPLSHLNAVGQNPNLQMGNHIVNKPTLQQLKILQQQQQQQQHQSQHMERHRKIMAAVGGMGNMGNVSNNMVGLGGLSNVVGIGGVRGMGPSMSAPMGPMSGLVNMNQNQMNPSQISNISSMLSQQLRPGTTLSNLQVAQAASMAKLRMAQNRAGMMGGPQPGITGMSGNNQMHVNSAGLSMLGQTLNRGNMTPVQRNMMASMGPPKAQGTSFYMNQQQQQAQFQQQQLQQQQQQQQQQMQPHQPPLGSPLQHQQSIVSQPQACSPSAMAIQQQLGSPSQASLQTPMSPQQLSSGVLQQMNAGNTGAGPASPQLSSQTLGSVNSITSSPMDLQGVSKQS